MADLAISQLPAFVPPIALTDLFVMVQNLSTTPITRKISYTAVINQIITDIGKVNLATGYTFAGGTASRTLTVIANSTIDQNLQTTASVVFGNVTAGASGTAGIFTAFPSTASNGTFILSATNSTGNFNSTLTNSNVGQSTTYTLGDPGVAATNLIFSTTAGAVGIQTIKNTTGFNTLQVGGLTGSTQLFIFGIEDVTSGLQIEYDKINQWALIDSETTGGAGPPLFINYSGATVGIGATGSTTNPYPITIYDVMGAQKQIIYKQITTPSNPVGGSALYSKSDGNLYALLPTGAEINLTAGGTSAHWTPTSNLLQPTATGTINGIKLNSLTASKGDIQIYTTDNSGNFDIKITNAPFGQTTTLTIADPGVSTAAFLLNNSPSGQTIFTGGLLLSVGNLTARALISSGLTGATAASRYVGATNSGAPVSGAFLVGDYIIARDGAVWICISAGSPGTWTDISGSGSTLWQIDSTNWLSPSRGAGFIGIHLYDAGNTNFLEITYHAGNQIYYNSSNAGAVHRFWQTMQAETCININNAISSLTSNSGIGLSSLSPNYRMGYQGDNSTFNWIRSNISNATSLDSFVWTAGTLGTPNVIASLTGAGNFTLTTGNLTVSLGNLTAKALIPSGLTGATAASRYVGATASGSPVSGTFSIGDYIIDQSGAIWICTVAGTPGTWVNVASGGASEWTAVSNLLKPIDVGVINGIKLENLAATSQVVFSYDVNNAFIQAQNNTGPVATNLMLQPTGANVGVGYATGSSLSSTLSVNGTISAISTITGTAFVASGLSFAPNGARFAGGITSGAPSSITGLAGDVVVDKSGNMLWIKSNVWANTPLLGSATTATIPPLTYRQVVVGIGSYYATGIDGLVVGLVETTANLALAYKVIGFTFGVSGTVTVEIYNMSATLTTATVQVKVYTTGA